jgi:branched-chain amino acid aminotransferase
VRAPLTPRPLTPPPPYPQDLSFGKHFTDHMLVCEHDARLGGWAAPRILPYPFAAAAAASGDDDGTSRSNTTSPPRPLLPGAASPALQALHYGGSCFEGMKAYPSPDGPRLFRPDLNAQRFARSAARLGLAPWSARDFLGCLAALVEKDAAWLPDAPGHSLYLRPFAYASEPGLGVHAPTRTAVAVIMSPVGPYFRSGAAPVSLLLDTARVRAWPGGTGSYKICGNYAPTVVPQAEAAAELGCAQVLYTMPAAALLGCGATGEQQLPRGVGLSDRVVGECGSMNVFFVLEQEEEGGSGCLELVTPPLDDGTILPGVTRASVLELARAWGAGGAAEAPVALRVSERHVTVRELRDAAARGRLREVFGTGTACVVQPVSELVLRADDGGGLRRLSAPGSASAAASAAAPGAAASGAPLWARLAAALADIQYGRVPGHPWSVRVADLLRASSSA